jgi:Lon protease-like protein
LSALLPLFPLDLVLFPGATLPLHIFEPRYREMIGACLVTRGLQRFEVLRLDEDRVFLQADVVYLQDVLGSPAPEDMTKAIALHGEILTLAGAQAESSSTIEEGMLSYHLASSLPLDLDFKQTLLAMNAEAERLHALRMRAYNRRR